MESMLNISSNPHIRDKRTTSRIMLDVIISLIPASVFGVYKFGLKALALIIVTMLTCVATEYIYEKCMKKRITIGDCSAALTGLLLALNLPANLPIWMAVIGGIFAILIVKQLFGGIGQNFMNPALAARCFLLISFAKQMTNFTLDGVSKATPLKILKDGSVVDWTEIIAGRFPGTIGETSIIAILIGAIYLLVKKIIDYRIPFFYIGTFAMFVIIYSMANGNGFDIDFLMAHLCGGGLMLGAFFMATDYVTSPITKNGRIFFGICLGIFTGMFRLLGSENAAPEGVSYAIIFCNLLVPLIEKITWPKAFGMRKRGKHEGNN